MTQRQAYGEYENECKIENKKARYSNAIWKKGKKLYEKHAILEAFAVNDTKACFRVKRKD